MWVRQERLYFTSYWWLRQTAWTWEDGVCQCVCVSVCVCVCVCVRVCVCLCRVGRKRRRAEKQCRDPVRATEGQVRTWGQQRSEGERRRGRWRQIIPSINRFLLCELWQRQPVLKSIHPLGLTAKSHSLPSSSAPPLILRLTSSTSWLSCSQHSLRQLCTARQTC